MDDHLDETHHVVSVGKFENNKRYKDQILQEIIAAICAMLNSNGGKVVIRIKTESNDIPVEGYLFSQMSSVTRILEQSMISIIGENQTVSYIYFKLEESIIISIGEADSLIITNYNLYLPSQTQVVEVSPREPLKRIKSNIMNRTVVLQPVQLGSHSKMFLKNRNCRFHESKNRQLKNLEASPSKRTTLADRMTCKSNKFICYVSAFANHSGGHIYYGITDDKVVEGEFIPNEKNKNEITKKVEKAINKMIWPEQISQPKRGVHWDIFFEPVLDENYKPIPSTFVIVIFIAPCLGGVFAEEPECYEMVQGKVTKMSLATWKERISQPVWLRSKKKILHSAKRTTWSSPKVGKALTDYSDKLRKMINNGNWDAFLKECESLENKSDLHETKQLVILYKKVTACNRRGKFDEARKLLKQYISILPRVKDTLIFEVIGLYLQAALERASGDFEKLIKLLTAALSKTEQIEPGLVTATVYVFAATVSDLITQDDPTNKIDSPYVLSMKALEHLHCVQDPSDVVVDMKRKAHITLATSHLGCNISGKIIKVNIDNSSLDKAETSIKVIHESAYQESSISLYFQIQINLMLSIFNYRRSQLSPNQRSRSEFLRMACGFAMEAKRRAKDYQFAELFKWSEANEDLCAKELKRVNNADHVGTNERDQRKDQCKGADDHDRTEQQEGDHHRESTEQRDHRDHSIQIAEKHTDRRGRTEQVERRDRTEQDGRLESSKEDSRSMEPEKNINKMEASKPGSGDASMVNIKSEDDLKATQDYKCFSEQQALALCSTNTYADNLSAPAQFLATTNEDINTSMYTVQATKPQNPSHGYEAAVPAAQHVFLPVEQQPYSDYVQPQRQHPVGFYSDNTSQANLGGMPAHVPKSVVFPPSDKQAQPQRDSRTPSGRQEQRYTPPGQSEMSKHVYAKPFQPASSSPSIRATHQIPPNICQVQTVSWQSNVTPAYHATGTSWFEGSVSSTAHAGTPPFVTEAYGLADSSYHQFPLFPYPPPTYCDGLNYRAPAQLPSYPTTMRVANQEMQFRAFTGLQTQMPTYQFPTLPRHRQPRQQHPQQQQQQQQRFRNKQHPPNGPRFRSTR